MQRRRFILDGLAESDRYQFLSAFVGRFTQALSLQFPPAFGYQVAWDEAHRLWRISRGKFWGVNVSLAAKDSAMNTWDLKFEAFFPVVHTYTEPIKRLINSWDNLTGPAKWISGHFLPA